MLPRNAAPRRPSPPHARPAPRGRRRRRRPAGSNRARFHAPRTGGAAPASGARRPLADRRRAVRSIGALRPDGLRAPSRSSSACRRSRASCSAFCSRRVSSFATCCSCASWATIALSSLMLLGIERGNRAIAWAIARSKSPVSSVSRPSASRSRGDPRPQFLDVALGLEDSAGVVAPAAGHAVGPAEQLALHRGDRERRSRGTPRPHAHKTERSRRRRRRCVSPPQTVRSR